MAILGGSPLGLIGVNSSPTRDGVSTFNGGSTRNVNVFLYNNVTESKDGTPSLFTGPSNAKIAPYGNINKMKTEDGGGDGLKYDYKGLKKSALHSNSIYDTSLLNIIEMLSGTRAALRPADFAYLKDVGVFPNNRLMVARRYASPLTDNIYGKGNVPIAVLIGWKPQSEDFLSIKFGEQWEDAKADFKAVMTSIGEDVMGKDTGAKVGGALAVVPLPGFTESLQRTVLQRLGVLDIDGEDILPSGNPNLIKIAKKRKTFGNDTAGSGLKCDISINMSVEYEQKFISGIDPTIAWQDIISKIGQFGTSRSQTYGLSAQFSQKMEQWVANPTTIATDIVKYIQEGLKDATDKLRDTLTAIDTAATTSKKQTSSEYIDSLVNKATSLVGDITTKQIQKYRIEIEGIARSLSGAPSAPWHITLGNPMRPIFCSGDMLVEDVTLSLGSILAFNDLPSSIKAEFTMTNARPWGLQEILAKFNSGYIRVSTIVLTSDSTNPGQTINDAPKIKSGTEVSPISMKVGDKLVSGVGNEVGGINQLDTNKVTQVNDVVNTSKDGLTNGATNALKNASDQTNKEQFEWSVLVDGRDYATGYTTSLEDAQRSIDTFATGGVVVDRMITSKAIGSTKEGKVDEAINSDANSSTVTSLIYTKNKTENGYNIY